MAELHAQLTAALAANRESKAALAKTHEEEARLTERNQAFQAESEGLRKKLTGEDPTPATAAATADSGKPKTASADFSKALSKMYADPEMKKMMRGQQGMVVRMMYGELAKELGLNPEQADAVMKILAERGADAAERGMTMLNGKNDPDSVAKAAQETEATKSKYDAQLKDALGDKYDGFQNYEKSIADRAVMQQYQTQFTSSGQPLSDDQRSGLLQIMLEERGNMPPDVFNAANKDVAAQMKALSDDDTLHTYLASQEELNRRVMARAGSVLDENQLATLATAQKNLMQMQQFGLRMGRTMMNSKSK
jgi:hypothetical protein